MNAQDTIPEKGRETNTAFVARTSLKVGTCFRIDRAGAHAQATAEDGGEKGGNGVQGHAQGSSAWTRD